MTDFWSGKDSRLVFFQDDEQVADFDVMSWSVKPEGTKANDGVCGEDRDRLQYIINNYAIQIEAKQQTIKLLEAFLEDQANKDARAIDLSKALGFLVYPLNGTQAAFQADEIVLDDWTWAVRGRAERNDISMPLRARYFKALATL